MHWNEVLPVLVHRYTRWGSVKNAVSWLSYVMVPRLNTDLVNFTVRVEHSLGPKWS